MRHSTRSVVTSWPFLCSLAVLLVNDWWLKAAYPGLVTGKLSDFAGLALVGFALLAQWPDHAKKVYIATAVVFLWWKSPLSEPTIQLFNSHAPIRIGRTVDYVDLVALAMLPLCSYVVGHGRRFQLPWPTLRMLLFVPAVIAAAFGTMATSVIMPPQDPVDVATLVDSRRFPPQVGAYRRGRVIEYQSRMESYSIEYDRYDEDLQHVVTLHFYPRERRLEEQFGREKLGVLRAHPGTSLVAEEQTLIWKDGHSFAARIATFEWDGAFADREQRISSQLFLIELPDRSFKVRGSGPAAQARAAGVAVRELLGRVDWAY